MPLRTSTPTQILQTRVIMKVFHPLFGHVMRVEERRARYQDLKDILRVQAALRATLPRGTRAVFTTANAPDVTITLNIS